MKRGGSLLKNLEYLQEGHVSAFADPESIRLRASGHAKYPNRIDKSGEQERIKCVCEETSDQINKGHKIKLQGIDKIQDREEKEKSSGRSSPIIEIRSNHFGGYNTVLLIHLLIRLHPHLNCIPGKVTPI